jgi:DNA invertase Pin-like site-specific DNA recombinase
MANFPVIGSTPAGRAIYQMLGVFAEFERAMIVGWVSAQLLARARVQGKTLGRRGGYVGREGREGIAGQGPRAAINR